MNGELRSVRRIRGTRVDAGQSVRAIRKDKLISLVKGRILANSHLNLHLESDAERVSLARKADYRARELARLCEISPRQLERYFQARFGQTPQEWLDAVRLREATDRLRGGKHVKEVAYEYSFIHPSHFIRKFKQRYGCTPMKFALAHGTEPFGEASPSPSAA